MRYAWVLLALALVGCTAQPLMTQPDLNIQQGVIDGARKSTAEAAERSSQATLEAWQVQQQIFGSTQTAIVAEAVAQTQQAGAGTATQYVSNQATQANQTAVAAVVAGADFSATETQRPLDRYATEDARALGLQATATMTGVEKDNAEQFGVVQRFAVGFSIVAITALVCFLLWQLGSLIKRKLTAEAEIAEIKALNAGMQVLPVLGIIITNKPGMDEPQITRISQNQIPATEQGSLLQDVATKRKCADVIEFLQLVQRKTGNEFATYIPRYTSLDINTGEWTDWTNELDQAGYIAKEDRKQTNFINNWNAYSVIEHLKDKAVQVSPSVNMSFMPGD